MSEISVRRASVDETRDVQRRRNVDDLTMLLSLHLAEEGGAFGAFDDAEAIGIAIAGGSSYERYVGELFVERSYRKNGIGARLLDAALAAGEDADRSFVFESDDRAALALALRRSLMPRDVLLNLAGAIPKEEALAAMAAGNYRFDVAALDARVHGFAMNALDRETRGATHAGDHARFIENATGQAFFLNGELVAYAYCWPDGRLGPIATASPAYSVQILAFTLVTLQRTYGASWCTALVAASNVRVCRAGLRAGLLINGTSALSSDVAADRSRYVAYHRLLL